jgi:uncharacterized peroxidase-related enzyme
MTDVEHISRKGTGVPVSCFPVPEESKLPENLRGLVKKARETVGFVLNVFRAYSFRPERLSAWFAHYRQLHEPTENLDAAEREMIAVAVSMANGCLYCLVAHGAALRQALGAPILADRITLDYRRAGLDDRRTAILDYAVKITERPLECTPEDLERLRDHGLTEKRSGTSWRRRVLSTNLRTMVRVVLEQDGTRRVEPTQT